MKKEILKEIINSFYSKALGLKKMEDFYIYKNSDYFGVALLNENNVEVNESFSNVILKTEKLRIDAKDLNFVTLMTNLSTHRNEFASFCMHFIENDGNGTRRLILNNPLDWWNKWKELIGNKLHNPKPYDVVAELLTIVELINKKEKIEWNGPLGSSIDITTKDSFYEVKSSLVRYENEVTISSQYQLTEDGKVTYLIYYKLERLEGGESIDSTMEKIKNKIGEENNLYLDIEKKLDLKGYKKHSSIRKIEYVIHEIREYLVDDKFPKITKQSFKEDKIPNNIKKIYYVVNLDNINYKIWNNGEENESS